MLGERLVRLEFLGFESKNLFFLGFFRRSTNAGEAFYHFLYPRTFETQRLKLAQNVYYAD